MDELTPDPTILAEIASAATRAASKLGCFPEHECRLLALAEDAYPAHVNFTIIWRDFRLDSLFFSRGILDQRAILLARGGYDLVSSAHAGENVLNAAIQMSPTVGRVLPGENWQYSWDSHEGVREKFEQAGDTVKFKLGSFPVGKSPYEGAQVRRIEQVAMEMDSTDPALGQTIRNALAVGDWDVLIAALKQCQ